jgi:intracellular sulfur oxidation DsrE/DsrF family protein
MKKILFFGFLMLNIFNNSILFSQNNIPHKIIMQLTSADPEVHKSLINQLTNLSTGWKDSVAIEIVCHGPGIQLLVNEKSTQKESVLKFHGKNNIRFVACENTMITKNITKDQIIPGMDYVLMGIAEIVRKQEQGWSYIKAGF